MPPKVWFQRQKQNRPSLKNPALAGRVLHNNLMYQDPSDGPCIHLVNAAVLDGEIEYRKQFLAKAKGEASDFTAAFDHLADLNLAYNERRCNQYATSLVHSYSNKERSKKQSPSTVLTSNFGKTICGVYWV